MIKRLPYIRSHARLLTSLLLGIACGLAWPDVPSLIGRFLLGWNVFVWTYLCWVVYTVIRADQGHVQKVAVAQAESTYAVLAIIIVASVVSFVAVFYELSAVKVSGSHVAWKHLLPAIATVVGSWLMVPFLFTLSYSSLFFGLKPGRGLEFPGARKDFMPDYVEFLYFAFTIAVALQTSDVAVTSREMRRLVLLQSVLAFVFNTTILAFSVNVGASLF